MKTTELEEAELKRVDFKVWKVLPNRSCALSPQSPMRMGWGEWGVEWDKVTSHSDIWNTKSPRNLFAFEWSIFLLGWGRVAWCGYSKKCVVGGKRRASCRSESRSQARSEQEEEEEESQGCLFCFPCPLVLHSTGSMRGKAAMAFLQAAANIV